MASGSQAIAIFESSDQLKKIRLHILSMLSPETDFVATRNRIEMGTPGKTNVIHCFTATETCAGVDALPVYAMFARDAVMTSAAVRELLKEATYMQ